MIGFKNITVLLMLLFLISPAYSAPNATVPAKEQAQTTAAVQTVQTTPLELTASPAKFLNKKIVMDGKFDKFSTLGLDYKKAYKDSAKYIGFLIQRDDVKDHNVPLSELKLFIKRDYAEKFIDLNTGDKISMSGVVFSNALGDAWVDIETIEVLEKAPNNKEDK